MAQGEPATSGEEAGRRAARLIAGEVVQVVHDGAAQMAKHEPEDCLENFFGCR